MKTNNLDMELISKMVGRSGSMAMTNYYINGSETIMNSLAKAANITPQVPTERADDSPTKD